MGRDNHLLLGVVFHGGNPDGAHVEGAVAEQHEAVGAGVRERVVVLPVSLDPDHA